MLKYPVRSLFLIYENSLSKHSRLPLRQSNKERTPSSFPLSPTVILSIKTQPSISPAQYHNVRFWLNHNVSHDDIWYQRQTAPIPSWSCILDLLLNRSFCYTSTAYSSAARLHWITIKHLTTPVHLPCLWKFSIIWTLLCHIDDTLSHLAFPVRSCSDSHLSLSRM